MLLLIIFLASLAYVGCMLMFYMDKQPSGNGGCPFLSRSTLDAKRVVPLQDVVVRRVPPARQAPANVMESFQKDAITDKHSYVHMVSATCIMKGLSVRLPQKPVPGASLAIRVVCDGKDGTTVSLSPTVIIDEHYDVTDGPLGIHCKSKSIVQGSIVRIERTVRLNGADDAAGLASLAHSLVVLNTN
jgi:hypothetical protein